MQKKPQPRLAKRLSIKASVPRVGFIQQNFDEKISGKFMVLFTNCKQTKRWEISNSYMSKISHSNNNALLHVGLCLPMKQLKVLYGILVGGNIQKQQQLMSSKQILFVSGQDISYQGASMMLWIYPPLATVSDQSLSVVFWAYPEIIFTTEHKYRWNGQKFAESIKFQKFMRFQQKIVYIGNQCEQAQFDATVKQNLFVTIKKNSFRIRIQHNIINVFLINQLLQYLQQNRQLGLLSDINQWQTSIVDNTISSYLSECIQKKYDQFYDELLMKLPISQQQLTEKLETFQQNIIKKMQYNLAVFLSPDRVEQYVAQAQMRLQEIRQQINHQNKQTGIQKNKSILHSIFAKFNKNFQNNNYSKNNIQELTTDFQDLLEEYDQKQIHINESFDVFNGFMLKNKSKLFRKVANLQSYKQNQSLKKRKNLQDDEQQLKDKILLKKHMLQTLQKQIKSLQSKKGEIEDKNEKMKKIWATSTPNLFFEVQRDIVRNSDFSSAKQQTSSIGNISVKKTHVQNCQSQRNTNKQMIKNNDINGNGKRTKQNKQAKQQQSGKNNMKMYQCCCVKCNIF